MIDEDTRQIPFEEMEHRAVQAEERAKVAKKKIQQTFASIASAALDAMAARAKAIISLFLMAMMFGYSMIDPSILRLAGATIFGLLLILAGMFRVADNGE